MKPRATIPHRFFVALLALATLLASPAAAQLAPRESLGKILYFDRELSLNKNQSCADCHFPPGYADPENAADPAGSVVSLGSVPGLNGGRNAPTSAYAAFVPSFRWDGVLGGYVGGQFADGRAATLKDQAKGPFLNPVEMAMPDKVSVVAAVTDPANPNQPSYLALFVEVYGVDLVSADRADPLVAETIYDLIADAIAAYEQSREVMPFTSKYDYWLAGKATLTMQERMGLRMFNGRAGCSACHPSASQTAPDGRSVMPPLFTNFTYVNLGLPKSDNPLIAGNPVDYGLGGRADIAAIDPDGRQKGKFRVPTLRNVALTAPYGHNGYFATLEDILRFYVRMAPPGGFPPPEVPANVNLPTIRGMGMGMMMIDSLAAFLRTLSDGYGPPLDEFPFPPFP